MDNYIFSQSSLQDYVDCPRRFELRYQMKIQWPGFVPEDPEEVSRSIALGNRFHLLCQQYFTGVPQDLIRLSIQDEALNEWWNNFLLWKETGLGNGQYYPEITLHARIAEQHVVAKFDLLQIQEETMSIYDWKTSSTRYPQNWLMKKVQTTLYPLVLCLAGGNLSTHQTKMLPENVEMVYWFASHPQNPETLPYSHYQFDEDLQRIENLIRQITGTAPGCFKLTEDEKRCRFCNYRSLCERHPDRALSGMEDEISFDSVLENLAANFETRLDEALEP